MPVERGYPIINKEKIIGGSLVTRIMNADMNEILVLEALYYAFLNMDYSK